MNIYRFLTFLVLRISCWRSFCGGFSTEMAALFRGCLGVVMALGGIEWEVHLRVSLGPTTPHPTPEGLGMFLWALKKRPNFSTSFYFKGSSPYLLFFLPLLSLGTSPSYQCEISGKIELLACHLDFPLNAINLSICKWHFSPYQIFLGAPVGLKTKPVYYHQTTPTHVVMLYPELDLSELPFSYLLKHLFSLCDAKWNSEWESALWSGVQTQGWGQWWRLLIACGSRHSTPIMLSASWQGRCQKALRFLTPL